MQQQNAPYPPSVLGLVHAIGGPTSLTLDVPKLIESRFLLQANSGAGKSWALRRILEQTWGTCQHLIIDVEGEFHTLREKFDYVLAGPRGADCPAEVRSAGLLARRLLELRTSAIIDISDLGHARTLFVKLFVEGLIAAPRDLWHASMVVVDEAQLFCPESGHSESAEAIIDLMTRGRKRGLCGMLATQRIAKLHKDAAAEANNKLIGRSALDIDMKRAAAELGITSKDEMAKLRTMPAGDFFAFGPAISTDVVRVTIGAVATLHPKAGFRAPVFTPRKQASEVLAKLADLPRAAAIEAATVADLQAQVRELEGELKRARAAQGEVKPVAPKVIERAVLKDAELKRAEQIIDRADRAARDARDQIGKVADRVIATLDGLRASVGRVSRADDPPALESLIEQNRAAWKACVAELGRDPTKTELVGAVLAAIRPAKPTFWAPPNVPSPIAPGYNPPMGATNGHRVHESPRSRGVPFDQARDQLVAAKAAGVEALSKMERAMLIAVAQHPQGLTRAQVLIFAGYQRSGTTNKAFGRLVADQLVESSVGRLIATERGLKALGSFEPLPTGDALRTKVLAELPKMHAAILWAVCQHYPHPIGRTAALGDYARSGTTNAAFGKLITMGYLRKVPGGVIAATELFS